MRMSRTLGGARPLPAPPPSATDHTRPQWEFHFLDVATCDAAATVVIRVHHALADGVSLIKLLVSSSRSAADPARPAALPPPPARRSGAVYAPPRSASALVWVWFYLVLAWHTLLDVVAFVATIFFLGDPDTLFKRKDHSQPHRRTRFIHRSFSLDDVKLLKKAMNYTVNDVLIGLTSAALSRYFFRKSGDTKTRGTVIRSIIPVNTRPPNSLQMDVDMIKSGKGDAVRWGNRMGYILFPFHLACTMIRLNIFARQKGLYIGKRVHYK